MSSGTVVARPALNRADRQALRAVLVGALSSPARLDSRWRALDPQLLLETSLLHGVAPALYLALRDDESAPQNLVASLRRVHDDQLFRHMRTVSELRRVAETMNRAGVPWVVVKGPILAEILWPRPDMRIYADLDIVVDRRHFDEALCVLAEGGATLVDRNWPMIRDQMRAELTLELEYGTHLDLHWHFVNEEKLRHVFEFPMDAVFQRSVDVTLPDGVVRTLDPVDTVIHLAYHTVHSGGHKLVWFKDVHSALQAKGLDARELVRRARAYGCELALALTVHRAEQLFGRVDTLTDRPRRSPWSGVAAVADRLRPVPTPPGVRFSGQIVFDNTRATAWASLVSTVGDVRRPRPPLDFVSANPLHENREDPEAKAAYLAAVQGERQP